MRAIRLLTMAVLLSLASCAKCPIATLTVEGEIVGVVDAHDSIMVIVTPEPLVLQPTPQMVGNHFVAEIRFNTLRSAGRFYHDCSRKPEYIKLALARDGVVVDQANLSFTRDFVKEGDVSFRGKNPIQLAKR